MLSQGPTGSAPGTASVYKMRLRADPHRSQITGRPAVVLRRPGRLAEGSSSWRSTAALSSSAAHHTPAKPRVISRQDLAPKWHFSVHLATWSRPEAPSFWD